MLYSPRVQVLLSSPVSCEYDSLPPLIMDSKRLECYHVVSTNFNHAINVLVPYLHHKQWAKGDTIVFFDCGTNQIVRGKKYSWYELLLLLCLFHSQRSVCTHRLSWIPLCCLLLAKCVFVSFPLLRVGSLSRQFFSQRYNFCVQSIHAIVEKKVTKRWNLVISATIYGATREYFHWNILNAWKVSLSHLQFSI